MSKAKAATTDDKFENAIQILKEATCTTSSGKSTLTYQVGINNSGEPQLCIVSNSGGGSASFGEWIAYSSIVEAQAAWPEDQPTTSMTFSKLFRGKSSNNPGFLIPVLVAEGLLEPIEDKKRVHRACDPARFLDSVEQLRKKAGVTSTKKTATKPKAKTPASSKAKAKAKTPRKT